MYLLLYWAADTIWICLTVCLSVSHIGYMYYSDIYLKSHVYKTPLCYSYSLSKLCYRAGGGWGVCRGGAVRLRAEGRSIIGCSLVPGEVEAVTVQSLQARIYQYADALSSMVPPPTSLLHSSSAPPSLLALLSPSSSPLLSILSFPSQLPMVFSNTPQPSSGAASQSASVLIGPAQSKQPPKN